MYGSVAGVSVKTIGDAMAEMPFHGTAVKVAMVESPKYCLPVDAKGETEDGTGTAAVALAKAGRGISMTKVPGSPKPSGRNVIVLTAVPS